MPVFVDVSRQNLFVFRPVPAAPEMRPTYTAPSPPPLPEWLLASSPHPQYSMMPTLALLPALTSPDAAVTVRPAHDGPAPRRVLADSFPGGQPVGASSVQTVGLPLDAFPGSGPAPAAPLVNVHPERAPEKVVQTFGPPITVDGGCTQFRNKTCVDVHPERVEDQRTAVLGLPRFSRAGDNQIRTLATTEVHPDRAPSRLTSVPAAPPPGLPVLPLLLVLTR